jgi:hypothetical protein
VNTLVNKFGTVAIGDRIAYPGRASSSLWMNFGTVVDITERVEFWSKEPKPVLKVRREGDSVDYSWRSPQVETKPRLVTITRVDNVVRIG